VRRGKKREAKEEEEISDEDVSICDSERRSILGSSWTARYANHG